MTLNHTCLTVLRSGNEDSQSNGKVFRLFCVQSVQTKYVQKCAA